MARGHKLNPAEDIQETALSHGPVGTAIALAREEPIVHARIHAVTYHWLSGLCFEDMRNTGIPRRRLRAGEILCTFCSNGEGPSTVVFHAVTVLRKTAV